MPGRTLALGDIHGCSAALDAVVEAAAVGPDDLLVTLGDYVDRGPDSRGVIDRLLALEGRCRLVPLRGNHDLMFAEALEGHARDPSPFDDPAALPELGLWLRAGGRETLASYGSLGAVPPEHVAFLGRLRDWHETDDLLFVHANYAPGLVMADQPPSLRYWASIREHEPGPHRSGKVAVVGHTSQKDGEILDLGHLICIDTCCYGGGWLTLLDLGSGRRWQADKLGTLRVETVRGDPGAHGG